MNKKNTYAPTTAIVTSGKILLWGSVSSTNTKQIDRVIDEGGEDYAVSYSSRGSAVNNVWDEADSYDGDILMK